jgi:hypothetical protein
MRIRTAQTFTMAWLQTCQGATPLTVKLVRMSPFTTLALPETGISVSSCGSSWQRCAAADTSCVMIYEDYLICVCALRNVSASEARMALTLTQLSSEPLQRTPTQSLRKNRYM